MKTIVIPDIHGQSSIFIDVKNFIIDECSKDNKINVIFLGDYSSKGESKTVNGEYYEDYGSRVVYEILFELVAFFKKLKINYILLMGNHEWELKNYLLYKKTTLNNKKLLYNAIDGFIANNSIIPQIKSLLFDMRYYYEDEKYFYAHAGVDVTKSNFAQSDISYFLWVRSHFFNSSKKFYKKVIFGHTIFKKILNKDDRIGLDGGAYLYKVLHILYIDNSSERIIKFKRHS
jgi:serine/threonine protein phosphatase 1